MREILSIHRKPCEEKVQFAGTIKDFMKSTSKLSELFAPLFFCEELTARNSFLETICIKYLSLQAIHKRRILWFVITAKTMINIANN